MFTRKIHELLGLLWAHNVFLGTHSGFLGTMGYPLLPNGLQFANWTMAIEIVDSHSKHRDFHSFFLFIWLPECRWVTSGK